MQEVEEWAKQVNSLRVSYDCDIYVTGSNSRLFSGEHLTYLSGRYIDIKIFPLSFSEYLDFKEYAKDDAQSNAKYFQQYIKDGSFPAPALVDDELIKDSIISGLFDSIFARDIILRGKISNETAFLKVAKFVFENIGSPISANSIARTLKGNGHSVSVDAVDNYLTLMCNAYVLYNCERYDVRGKERLRTNGKYYCTDLSLRSRLVSDGGSNLGHILENLVFLELLRRGFDVTTGVNVESKSSLYSSPEVDFVAKAGSETVYFQVSASVMSEETLTRELRPLKVIKDNFPKYLLTMDNMDFSQDGIIHMNLVEWLLKTNQ